MFTNNVDSRGFSANFLALPPKNVKVPDMRFPLIASTIDRYFLVFKDGSGISCSV